MSVEEQAKHYPQVAGENIRLQEEVDRLREEVGKFHTEIDRLHQSDLVHQSLLAAAKEGHDRWMHGQIHVHLDGCDLCEAIAACKERI